MAEKRRVFTSGKAISAAVATNTLKITHLDLAKGHDGPWHLGAEDVEAMSPAPAGFGLGAMYVACWTSNELEHVRNWNRTLILSCSLSRSGVVEVIFAYFLNMSILLAGCEGGIKVVQL